MYCIFVHVITQLPVTHIFFLSWGNLRNKDIMGIRYDEMMDIFKLRNIAFGVAFKKEHRNLES